AWGAQPVRVPLAGDAADAVFPINDLLDYGRFREAAKGKRRVLIFGAGLIGCEFANDLLQGGYAVELVAPDAQVMPTLLPPAAATAVRRGLESLGARFHFGVVAERLERTASGLQARLSDGQCLECDLVVSAVGLRPRTELAEAAGLEVGRGIVVDRFLRTSAEHVYALGDCAEVGGLNLLYVMPLMSGVRALSRTLSGTAVSVSYGPMPVTVKAPGCRLVAARQAEGRERGGDIGGEVSEVTALFRSPDGRLLGYALPGRAVERRLALNKELPPLL